ncbi:DUF3825 domain-containing protein [Kallipyga gabonensis]|uniref:DUF3825 domain-containing protein n=1 Tax=Kallipyga gabonensis TaxID=1686287 RepID=UPI0006B4FAB0|nr:DUF3825 domain-containing protein [Kallipyga gabonensis]
MVYEQYERGQEGPLADQPTGSSPLPEKDLVEIEGKYPKPQDALEDWAFINFHKYDKLAELALPEKWYYGDTPPKNNKVPLLKNYLNYTFKRLVREEKKIRITKDTPPQETYAAFNTGLVDRKYDDIYALFKQNTKFESSFWYLLDFVVAGENVGKTLVRVFNPLPGRADYFENKVENMLYDSSTGELSCDYPHIIVERTRRLPMEFLEDNLARDMMEIDGMTLQEAYQSSDRYRSKIFFQKLGEKIEDNQRVFNRLKNRLQDAVDLAIKRVEWNYKTAIPMYNPRSNKGSLLLPLCLMDDNRVDLALVVVRHPSGSYQGETILPLFLAYSNSRLVSRPDSDWLNTDSINILSYEDDENEDDEY